MLATLYWQYSQALPWAFGVLIAVAFLLLWLYPSQLRISPGALRWAMPVLRLIAMGALILSILRPVMSRPRNVRERGPVVMLLDTSRSMSVVDQGRPVGQWVAIAAALGRLPGSLRDPDLQTTQTACERLSPLADDVARARAERDYAQLSGGAVDAANSRLDQGVRDLQSTARDAAEKAAQFDHGDALHNTLEYLAEVPPGIDQEVWYDHIGDRARAAAVEAEQARIANDAKLYRSNVQVMDACKPLQSMSRLMLSQTAVTDSAAGLLTRLDPDVPVVIFGIGDHVTRLSADAGSGSAAGSALNAVGNSTNLVGGIRSALRSIGDVPARAAVLFSDGRQIDGDSSTAATFGGVPIFTVAAAARSGLRDLTVSEVSSPASAFVGETVNVNVVVRGIGLGGQSTVVALDDRQTRQSRPIKFMDNRPMPIDFKWTARIGGANRLTIEATNLPGEISVENNRAERWIKVFDHKCRIAIAAGSPGQDVEIARRAISNLPWAELVKIAIGNSGQIAWSPAEIGQFDCLFLSAIRANSFDNRQWAAIANLVTERGGSVILVPGENGSFTDANTIANGLLPFARTGATNWHLWPAEQGGFRVSPVPGMHALDLGDSGDAFWQTLSPIQKYVPIAPLKSGVRALLVESESGTPMLTEARLGRGRVLCLGTDEIWRWRATNAEYPSRFYRQIFFYAGGDPYESRDGGVLLDVDPVAAVPDRLVRVRVRIRAGAGEPTAVKIRLLVDEKIFREQSLSASLGKGTGLFDGTLSNLPEGDYEIEADAGPALGHPRAALHVHSSAEAEMADLSGDENWLRHLAESTGGRSFRLDQVDQLPQRIRDLPADLSHPVELTLWDGPYLYALVLGCLAAEWGLRKRFGLA